jgi:hypothetical protein
MKPAKCSTPFGGTSTQFHLNTSQIKSPGGEAMMFFLRAGGFDVITFVRNVMKTSNPIDPIDPV